MTDDDLIRLIYSAAINDDWQAVASAFAAAGGDINTHLYGHDTNLNKGSLAAVAGYDPGAIAVYDSYYHDINAWLPGISTASVGKATFARDFCSDEVFQKTEFYQDWIRPQENVSAGGGIVLFNDSTRFVLFGGAIRSIDAPNKEAAWISLLDRMGPHLRHAFELQRTLEGQRLATRGYLDVIEMMGNAVLLLDADGRIQFHNEPPRVYRRPFGLSYAAIAGASSMA